MKAAISDRQADTLAVGTQTVATIVQYNDGTAPPEVLGPVEAPNSTIEDDDVVLRMPRARSGTSNLGRRADCALVIALLAPPALIALLMAIGLQFALAVCAMFAFVFVITTSVDVMWMWRFHTDRKEELQSRLVTASSVCKVSGVGYSREVFGYAADTDGDAVNTRAEVLQFDFVDAGAG